MGQEPGPVAGVRGEQGGAFGEGGGQGRVAGPAGAGGRRRQFRREASAGAERARAPVPGPARPLGLAVQHAGEQPVDVTPVVRRGRLVHGDPGPGVAEADPAHGGVGDSGGLGGLQGPGVEPGRGDGAQEGVGGHRVLVGGGEQEQQPGVVREGADLPAVGAQHLGGQLGGVGGQRVEAGRLLFGEPRREFGGGARVAVHQAQHAQPDALGERADLARPRGRGRRWRSAVERWGVHRSHHTTDVTGELIEP
ncbi:hypothetical protein [Streptomyces phaeofaciens]